MAKEKENKLTAARQILTNEQAAYEKLIKKPTEKLSASEKEKHIVDCKDALHAKRQAKEVVEALWLVRPVPQNPKPESELK